MRSHFCSKPLRDCVRSTLGVSDKGHAGAFITLLGERHGRWINDIVLGFVRAHFKLRYCYYFIHCLFLVAYVFWL